MPLYDHARLTKTNIIFRCKDNIAIDLEAHVLVYVPFLASDLHQTDISMQN